MLDIKLQIIKTPLQSTSGVPPSGTYCITKKWSYKSFYVKSDPFLKNPIENPIVLTHGLPSTIILKDEKPNAYTPHSTPIKKENSNSPVHHLSSFKFLKRTYHPLTFLDKLHHLSSFKIFKRTYHPKLSTYHPLTFLDKFLVSWPCFRRNVFPLTFLDKFRHI